MLKADPLDWLLEADSENPGVRLWALTDLLDQLPDAPEVSEAQRAVMSCGPVPAILGAQDPDGSWVKAGCGYSPKYRGTIWQIMFLAELGADARDVRIQQGCEYVLRHAIASNGAFSYYRRPAPCWTVRCLNGNLLSALLRLGLPLSYWSDVLETAAVLAAAGYGNDPRLDHVLELIVSKQDGQARWKLENSLSGKMWIDIEERGKPSKWITLRALRVLKGAGMVQPVGWHLRL